MSIEQIERTRIVDHDCPYEEHLSRRQKTERLFGGSALMANIIFHERALVDIHSEGVCPPTHVDNDPTRVWSDWVQDLKR